MMMMNNIEFRGISPEPYLSDFVESFWMLANRSEVDKEIIILPDGRIDLLFSYSAVEPFHIALIGLESMPVQTRLVSKEVLFAVSFKLLAVEYLQDINISGLLNKVRYLPSDFWGITKEDLKNFNDFCGKVSNKMKEILKGKIDERKQKLFELIYSSSGAMTVKELSESVCWSSRQINRYFKKQFGMSLKAYCTILRFKGSFQHIKNGILFPELNFTDQAHFIKEVKKFSGVVPKQLSKNENNQFIQFSILLKK